MSRMVHAQGVDATGVTERQRDVTIYVTKCEGPINPLVCSQTVLTVLPFWDESVSPVG